MPQGPRKGRQSYTLKGVAEDRSQLVVEVQLYKNKFYLKKGHSDGGSPSVSWAKVGIPTAWAEVKLRLGWMSILD